MERFDKKRVSPYSFLIFRIPNYKFDSNNGFEKRIKQSLMNFLFLECPAMGHDYRLYIPSGNSTRHYIIPAELESKFFKWFKEQDKNGFRNFDGKRKAPNNSETTTHSSKRQKSGSEVHEPFSLNHGTNLDESHDLESFEKLLGFNKKLCMDLKPKIKIWLLLKLGGRFPSSIVANEDKNAIYGIPKYLLE